jgi:hypothetical protein
MARLAGIGGSPAPKQQQRRDHSSGLHDGPSDGVRAVRDRRPGFLALVVTRN